MEAEEEEEMDVESCVDVREVSAHGLGYDVVVKLMQPYLSQGYQLFVDNFYTSVPLFKMLFTQGVTVTGTIIETRRNFPAVLKNSKAWAKGKERGANCVGHGMAPV